MNYKKIWTVQVKVIFAVVKNPQVVENPKTLKETPTHVCKCSYRLEFVPVIRWIGKTVVNESLKWWDSFVELICNLPFEFSLLNCCLHRTKIIRNSSLQNAFVGLSWKILEQEGAIAERLARCSPDQIEQSGCESWSGSRAVLLGKTLYSHSGSLPPRRVNG